MDVGVGAPLLGLKFHMNAPTEFIKDRTARPAEFSSPQQDILMTG
jgi:hypothetical protein